MSVTLTQVAPASAACAAGRVEAVEHHVDRQPEPAQQRRRRAERGDLGVEVVLGTIGARRRRRVRGPAPARRLLRLLGPFVVAPHRVRVGEQLQLRVRRQVLPGERVELPGHPRVGLGIVQQDLDRRGPVDDLRLVRRRGGISPPWPRSGSVSSGLGQRTDRRERVPQPLRRAPAVRAGRGPASSSSSRRSGPSRSRFGQRAQQSRPRRGRRRGPAGPRGAAVIAARCRSTAWSLIRLAGLVRHVSVESAGVGKRVDTGPGRQHGRPRRRRPATDDDAQRSGRRRARC